MGGSEFNQVDDVGVVNVIAKHKKRGRLKIAGRRRAGTTEPIDLTMIDWLQSTQDGLMDGAVGLEWLQIELKEIAQSLDWIKKKVADDCPGEAIAAIEEIKKRLGG